MYLVHNKFRTQNNNSKGSYMGITAKELARKLNLSAAAVSMALNHKPGVSTATRQLVLDAAEKYGYDFSRIAEKHTTSGAIYFVIYKKHGTVVADTPFFSQVSEGISQGCKKNDYRLKISYIYEDEDTITKQIEEIQYSDCAGIILLGTEMEGGDLKPAGMSSSRSIVHSLTPSMEGAYTDMLELIKNGEELASCYFADNDLIAVGAMKALKESGYRIPQDIGIVGFDNLPLGSVVEPALTTIHVPKQYMGEAAAQKLIDLLNTPGQPPTKTEVSTMLVKRGTV